MPVGCGLYPLVGLCQLDVSSAHLFGVGSWMFSAAHVCDDGI